MGFGPFRSPLLRASQLIPLPPGTEMFQFPGFASLLRVMTELAPRRVAPFGHPRINACVPLPLAYRSLPRPSSPLCAQASSTCYRSLDYKVGSLGIGRLIRHSPPRSCIPSRARAIDRVQSPRSFRRRRLRRSRVSTQNSDKSLYQLFACSCDSSISHDLPFVPLSNSDRDGADFRGEPPTIFG